MEKKTSKYLKYAIGEIILVVIGILIALQINNWNEQNKQAKIEKTFLKRLQIDIRENILTWEDHINKQVERNKGVKAFIKFSLDQNMDSLRVIFPYFNSVLTWNNLTISQVTFNEMQSSGKLDIIKNDSIKIKLLQLDQHYERVLKHQENLKTAHEKYVSDHAMEVLDYLDYIVVDESKKELHPKKYSRIELRPYYMNMQTNVLKLVNDKIFMNSLVGSSYNHEVVLGEMQEALSKARALDQLIELELENN